MAAATPDPGSHGQPAPSPRARLPFFRAFFSRATATTAEFSESGVGRLLCATRMRIGKDLQQVAHLLHIRYTYLVAIEDGRYEDLPGQAYAIGFVRAYADHLGLDGDEVVRRFKEETTGLKRKAALDFPIPTPDSGIPSGVALLGAILLGMSVYGAWFAIAGASGPSAAVQEVPARLAPPPPEVQTAEPGPAEPAPPREETAARPPSDLAPTEPDSVKPAEENTQTADAGPVDVLELRAKTDSWIQIRDGETLMLTRLLKKGEVYRVPDRPGLSLMTGNAGGIEVLVNGQVMAPLGESGAVASGVALDSKRFKAGG